MRNDVSRLKYLAFVLGLGACFFDPHAIGPGNKSNPQLVDGGASGNGTAGPSGPAGKGGDGSSGSGAISGTSASGTGGTSIGTSGVGGMSGGGGTNPPPPPLLVNGESCTDDARCKSGHCDGICCDKGAECCKTVADCTAQPGGQGMT
jgi:hypothetical protein